MKDTEIEKIKQCIEQKSLCAINRDMIDELTTYCFPLALSDRLVLLANVYDFSIDGYKIMRTQDITEVFCDDAEEFNEMIIRKEGVLDDFNPKIIDVKNLKNVFDYFLKSGQSIIVQCEGYDESLFYVGKIGAVLKNEIELKTFDGCGVWDKKSTKIAYNKITCVSYGSRYVTVLSKYLSQ